MTLIIRTATADEERYIADSWSRSFAPRERKMGGDPFVSFEEHGMGVAPPVWYAMHREWAMETIDSGDALLLVVAHSAVPDEVLGWVCWAKDGAGVRLHYVHVKARARRRGIGAMLVGAATRGADFVRLSHRNEQGAALVAHVWAQHEHARSAMVPEAGPQG